MVYLSGTIMTMGAKTSITKCRVKQLRTQGKTYSEILNILKLNIPKSTLSDWCRDIPLPKWYKEKITKINRNNITKAQKAAWASNKIKQENILSKIKSDNKNIFKIINKKQILKTLLSFLYLGEGAKWKSHRGLMLGSSDPLILKLYIHLLKLCYDIKPEELKCRVSYRADQNINKLQEYWSKEICVPLKNFYKTIPDPRTVGKPTKNTNYMGVCVLTCGGTIIQLELAEIPKIILAGR